MDVGDGRPRIWAQVLAQVGNEHIHAATHKVAVVAPYQVGDQFPPEHAVDVLSKELENLSFLLGQLLLLATPLEAVVLVVKAEFPNGKHIGRGRFAVAGAAQNRFDLRCPPHCIRSSPLVNIRISLRDRPAMNTT